MQDSWCSNRVGSLLSLVIPIVLCLTRPLGLSLQQSFILGSLFVAILWWATNWVSRDVASLSLLAVFLLFSGVPAVQVLNFALSPNIFMIVAAFLLSEGVVRSQVADGLSAFLLGRFCRTYAHIAIASFVLCTFLIFLIPQPYPRGVLLAAIYSKFLLSVEAEESQKKVLMFSIFVAATVTTLMFVNGDVIANYTAMDLGQVHYSYVEWIKYMTIPTILASVAVCLAFIATFRRELLHPIAHTNDTEVRALTPEGKKALIVTVVVVVLWLTEPLHGVGSAIVAVMGVALMLLLRTLRIEDFKVVNYGLLLFLTSVFAVGRVLVVSGIAERIRLVLLQVLPAPSSLWFLPSIVLAVMAMHMVFGSVMTTISVSIPMVVVLTEGVLMPELVVLLVLASAIFHFVLPYHHVTVMIGFGSGYYDTRHVVRFGLPLTFVVLASVFFLYLPWWRLTGLV